ncbi:MAG TPA: hypothetical protein PK358_10960 [Spirochaetota bacterium]|nr:hypothetical protein [Spirochaetota bacterium]HPJ35347.1 hypothetical protein [Spirochaetota bacterium]
MKPETSSNRWRTEQLSYFREYIKTFKPGSMEYKRLNRDITQLEKQN